MKKIILPLISAAAMYGALSGPAYSGQAMPEPVQATMPDDGRVAICHIPPGNPGKARSITVDAASVDAHLAHGDSLGGCE